MFKARFIEISLGGSKLKVHNFLLASAALIVSSGGAFAADLGVKKPASVEYVKICTAYGAGFFYLPGSNTCVKMGGGVAFEARYKQVKHNRTGVANGFGVSAGQGDPNKFGYRSRGDVYLDSRTATEYGTLRTYVKLTLRNATGTLNSGNQQRRGVGIPATGADFANKSQTQIDFTAYVQFAGLTAGRLGSFYEFLDPDTFIGTGGTAPFSNVNLIAYTATFGSGFSATISAEDAISRRQIVTPGLGITNLTGFTAGASGTTSAYGGSQVPDLVGNLRVDQAWGSAQVSGVLHQVNTNAIAIQVPALGGPTISNFSAKYGYAFQGGITIKLPMLAAGDEFSLQGSYSKGATQFGVGGNGPMGVGAINGGGFDGYNPSTGVDAAVYSSRAPGAASLIKLATTYGVFANLQHYWTPTIRQNFFGAWGVFDQGRVTVAATSPSRFVEWQIGTNVIWSPVKFLNIGIEVQYERNSNNVSAAAFGGALPLGVTKNSDHWMSQLKITRNF